MANTTASAVWQIVTGRGCELSRDGRCVTDGPGPYRNLDGCSVIALQPLTISMATYFVEARFDYLSIRNVAYRSEQYPRGPDGVSMLANEEMRWVTDMTVSSNGFEACAFPVEWEGGSTSSTQPSFFSPYWIFFGPLPCLLIFILLAFRVRTRRQMAWDRRLSAQNTGSLRSHVSRGEVTLRGPTYMRGLVREPLERFGVRQPLNRNLREEIGLRALQGGREMLYAHGRNTKQ